MTKYICEICEEEIFFNKRSKNGKFYHLHCYMEKHPGKKLPKWDKTTAKPKKPKKPQPKLNDFF